MLVLYGQYLDAVVWFSLGLGELNFNWLVHNLLTTNCNLKVVIFYILSFGMNINLSTIVLSLYIHDNQPFLFKNYGSIVSKSLISIKVEHTILRLVPDLKNKSICNKQNPIKVFTQYLYLYISTRCLPLNFQSSKATPTFFIY